MLNPFELRTIVGAKHAQHVVLVHFPIALFITGVLFDLLSRGKRGSELAAAAYLNLSVAAISVFPVATTGLLAWQFALAGKKLKGLLLWHLIAALLAAYPGGCTGVPANPNPRNFPVTAFSSNCSESPALHLRHTWAGS